MPVIVHAKVTSSRVARMIQANEAKCQNKGICLACGKTIDGCEPDARFSTTCTSKGCKGAPTVFGAEEIMLRGAYAGTPMPVRRPKSSGLASNPTSEINPEITRDAHAPEPEPEAPVSAELRALDAEMDALLAEINRL